MTLAPLHPSHPTEPAPLYFATLADQARDDVKRIAEDVTTRRKPVVVCETCGAISGRECRTVSGRKAKRWHSGRRVS